MNEGKWMGDGMNELCEQWESWANGVFRHRSQEAEVKISCMAMVKAFDELASLRWLESNGCKRRLFSVGNYPSLFRKEQLSICRNKVLGLPPSFFLSWMVRVVFPTEFWAKQTNLLLRSLWVTVVRTAVYSMTVLLKLDSGLGKEKKTWHPRSATSIANHPGELGRQTKLVGIYQKTWRSTRRWGGSRSWASDRLW